MSDRIMLDGVNWRAVVAAIKAGTKFYGLPVTMAAGYLDGLYAYPPQAWTELQAAGIPARSLVGYTVTGSGGNAMKAAAGDAEPGDMDPAHVAAWAAAEHAKGEYPAPYCSRSWKPQVIAECAKLGLELGKNYGLIVATLDKSFTDLDGSDLRTQHGVLGIQVEQAHSPLWQGGAPDLDVTFVVAPWWRAPKPPAPPPPPPVAQLDGVVTYLGTDGKLHYRGVISKDGDKTWA